MAFFYELKTSDMNANNVSDNAPISDSHTMVVVSVDGSGDGVETRPGVLISPDTDMPGVLISPAKAGMLRVRANTVAVQIAFIIFMVFLQFGFSG
jgi:hypothetical protein